MDTGKTVLSFQEYLDGLEEERRKIKVFQREFPFCLELVEQAIKTCRQQMTFGLFPRRSQSMEGFATDGAISLKSHSSSSDEAIIHRNNERNEKIDMNKNMPHWLKSVNDNCSNTDQENLTSKSPAMQISRNGGAFHPFQRADNELKIDTAAIPTPPCSVTRIDEDEKNEGRSNKKTRRSWSPELHRHFVLVLQQLGGSHVATPKQIRELMKVDGLTNDEVKSHLQKYRLYTKRLGDVNVGDDISLAPPPLLGLGSVPTPESAFMDEMASRMAAHKPTCNTIFETRTAVTESPNLNRIYAPTPASRTNINRQPKVPITDQVEVIDLERLENRQDHSSKNTDLNSSTSSSTTTHTSRD